MAGYAPAAYLLFNEEIENQENGMTYGYSELSYAPTVEKLNLDFRQM